MHIEVCKLFCDLIENQSFSITAERHGVTQSAVSQKIRALEAHFNAPLLERGRYHIRLTPAGQVFLESARQLLQTYEELHGKIDALQNQVSGLLKIATVASIGLHELPIYIRRFKKEYPEVEVRVEYRKASQVYAEVIDGRIDLGLVAYPQRRKGIAIHSFWRDHLVVICGPDHPFANRFSASLTDLQGQDFVGFQPDLPTRKALDAMLKRSQVEVNRAIEFDTIDAVKRAVELGSGLSIVPHRAVQKEVETGRLRALMFDDEECWRPLAILGKRNRAMTPTMREFIRVLTHGREVSGAFPEIKSPATLT